MIKNAEVYAILGQLDGWVETDGKRTATGLLNEETGLGLKRKLRKIQKELITKYQELEKDHEEIKALEDGEEREKEMKAFLEEGFELQAEKASMAEIEKISSDYNYNFDLIELIAQ